MYDFIINKQTKLSKQINDLHSAEINKWLGPHHSRVAHMGQVGERQDRTNQIAILVDVAVEPVMYHYVPRAIIVGKCRRIPPILSVQTKPHYRHISLTNSTCKNYLYIKRGLWIWPRAWLGWTDGRTTFADRLQAPAKGEGAARCMAYECAGTSTTVVIYNTA